MKELVLQHRLCLKRKNFLPGKEKSRFFFLKTHGILEGLTLLLSLSSHYSSLPPLLLISYRLDY